MNHRLKKWLTFDWKATFACLVGAVVLYPFVSRIGLIGHDWYIYFYAGNYTGYPPWTRYLLLPLTSLPWRDGFGLLNAILLSSVAVLAAREAYPYGRNSMMRAALLAVLSSPVWMLMLQGTMDAVLLLGLVALPYGAVILLTKPQIAAWALLADVRSMVVAIITMIISLLIWGLWPLELVESLSHRNLHPVAMGWQNLTVLLLPLGIMMLLFSRRQMYAMMAAGAFIAPYLMPVHLVLLIPAFGALTGRKRLALWLLSWLLLLPEMFLSPLSKFVAMLFPLVVWWWTRGLQNHNEGVISTTSSVGSHSAANQPIRRG